LERSNSLRKILDSQAGSLSRRTDTARARHRTGVGTVHALISEAGGTRSTRAGCVGVESTRRRHGEWLVVALRNIRIFIHLWWRWRSRQRARFDLSEGDVAWSVFQDGYRNGGYRRDGRRTEGSTERGSKRRAKGRMGGNRRVCFAVCERVAFVL
jgi:hypothetical protein